MQSSSKKHGTPGTSRSSSVRLSDLPSVGKLLESPAFRRLVRQWGAPVATRLLRVELDQLRLEIRAGGLSRADLRRSASTGALARRVDAAAARLLAPRPRAVINATGVVVHTNLGRSILSESAAGRVAEASTAYMDLEYDTTTGKRGSRFSHLEPLMEFLFPEQGFLVVNNNAAAIMLTLRALARRKDVVVSRGELVEIGGSFRVPDILSASGARLREVGTTNRTRLSDYEAAISSKTGLLLKVHTSNFKVVGFTGETSVRSLASLAKRSSVPLVVDWGSGDLVELGPLGIRDERPVSRLLDEGADLVTFSGDKLLGGPQAGFVVGRPDLVARLRKDPLARVCRIDRLLACALHETLAAYVRDRAFHEVPTLGMLARTPEEIGRRAGRVRREIARRTGAGSRMDVVKGVSRTGGGSSPTGERPTRLLAIGGSAEDAALLERILRAGEPPVIGRIHEGRLLLDLRTVLPSQEPLLIERLIDAIRREEEGVAEE